VLAASRGSALGELTESRPKAMVEIQGQPLLGHIVSAYNAVGLKQITVVRGYLGDVIDLPGLSYVDNPDYADTGELASLARALEADTGDSRDLFISFGDVIFKRYMLDLLIEQDDDFVIAVDTEWMDSANRGRSADYVRCSEPHSRNDFYSRIILEQSAEDIPENKIHGEWMGLLLVRAGALPRFREAVEKMAAAPEYRRAKLHHLLNELVQQGEQIRVVYTTGHWLDVDSLEDVVAAGRFT
jgi:phosphoenolpyruvate phosphomutase